MEPKDASMALDQTAAQLQGGVLRLGIGSVIPVIAGWEQTLRATGLPHLVPIAENLETLRTRPASEDSDAAEVGRLLQELGGQVRGVAASPYGSPISLPLTQFALVLDTGGATLLKGGMS